MIYLYSMCTCCFMGWNLGAIVRIIKNSVYRHSIFWQQGIADVLAARGK